VTLICEVSFSLLCEIFRVFVLFIVSACARCPFYIVHVCTVRYCFPACWRIIKDDDDSLSEGAGVRRANVAAYAVKRSPVPRRRLLWAVRRLWRGRGGAASRRIKVSDGPRDATPARPPARQGSHSLGVPVTPPDYSERNCADTVGTVPVPSAGHFRC